MLKDILQLLPQPIIGVDEAGRGCLAGPVAAGAVILQNPKTSFQDSKTLSAEKRKTWALKISQSHKTGLGWACAEEVDRLNIHRASLLAMKRAVLNLNLTAGSLIIDGKYMVPDMNLFFQMAVVKGDALVSSVSAASIVAKYFRDEWMQKASQQYPHYGWEQNKGYPTDFHKKAIQQYGPCPFHRKTFAGVKEYFQETALSPSPLG